ncbi:hypothetical protein ACOTEO_22435 [Achromobacter xylosoxidans]|uniref:hypothetical protein n=1 Tax=Achromobacter TaxID=222 RepID=UPI000B150D2C|nr:MULTISPECIES: hypothetical protein [Achromobacter]
MSTVHSRKTASSCTQQAPSLAISLSLEGVEPTDAQTWAQIEAAARQPTHGRRYPEIAEVPDCSSRNGRMKGEQ